jgi:DNA-binding MarR family transcriptional regulator
MGRKHNLPRPNQAGQIMPRNRDKTGRSKQLSSFIALERFIKASAAWNSLSLAARCVYWELLDLYNGANNGRIALSARVLAKRLPISRATATRALNELEDRQFI